MIEFKDNDFGNVDFEGVTVRLTQQAYVVNAEGLYQANGVDADGNDYTVSWQAYDNWLEFEDESDACNWDKYTVQKL
jgi:hypothetical protein